MNLQKAFEEKIRPLKIRISEKDYKAILEAVEDFGHSLLLANLLARTINAGINIHFWWHNIEGIGQRLSIEADNIISGKHYDGDLKGYQLAEDAMIAIINILADEAKLEDANKQRIIKPN